MKKNLLLFVAGSLSMLALTSTIVAQNANAIASGEKSSKYSFTSAPFIFSGGGTLITEEKINTRALTNFKNSFKNVTNETWYTIDGGYMANFLQKGISTRADYDKKGHWISTLKSYKADKAPHDVIKVIMSNYYESSITSIQEVETRDQLAYLVHLEDKLCFRNVVVVNGRIEKVTEYKKGL